MYRKVVTKVFEPWKLFIPLFYIYINIWMDLLWP